MAGLPLLIVTPHSAGYVPQDVLWDMIGEKSRDPGARQQHLDYLFGQGDPFTDVIFHHPAAFHLYASVSRFVVDLNRERSTGGRNGVVKLTDFDATPLYPSHIALTPADIEERLVQFWDPFHEAAEGMISRHKIELLLVGHAMSAQGPEVGPDTGRARPALCLMTGGDGQGNATGEGVPTVSPQAARKLRESAERHFALLIASAPDVPNRVALNDPWSADEVSVRYSSPARPNRIAAFGLEINRNLYLNDVDAQINPLPGRLTALQQACAGFASEALEIVRNYPLGGDA